MLNGLLVAIAVSLAMLIRELSQPRLSVLGRLGRGHDFVSIAAHPDAVTVPGLLILRPEEPLFFANVEAVLDSAAARLATAALDTYAGAEPRGIAGPRRHRHRSAGPIRRRKCARSALRIAARAAQGSGVRGAQQRALPGLTGAALSGASVDAVVTAALAARDVNQVLR